MSGYPDGNGTRQRRLRLVPEHWLQKPHQMSRAPNGGVVEEVNTQLRYFDPSTWRWSALIEAPTIRGMKTWFGQTWTADDIWIVKVWGTSLLDQLLHLGKTPVSTTNYFCSRDHGMNWVPFSFTGGEGSHHPNARRHRSALRCSAGMPRRRNCWCSILSTISRVVGN